MSDARWTLAIVAVIIGLLVAGMISSFRWDRARNHALNQCIVENKELPNPAAFCRARWELQKGE